MVKDKRKILRFENGNIADSGEINKISDKTKNFSKNIFQGLGIASELGFVISIPIVGGIFLGSWLDKKFSLYPKLTLSFLFLGVFLAIANLIYIVREISKKFK